MHERVEPDRGMYSITVKGFVGRWMDTNAPPPHTHTLVQLSLWALYSDFHYTHKGPTYIGYHARDEGLMTFTCSKNVHHLPLAFSNLVEDIIGKGLAVSSG